MEFYKNKLFIISVLVLLLIIFFIWQNNHIVTSKIEYKNSKIPKDFNGFRIVHISDLHNKRFGKEQNTLLKKIDLSKPDIIVITGDLIDRRKYNLDISMDFIKGAIEIAPIYYVPGNHEAWSGKYDIIKKELSSVGVIVLDDEKREIIKGDSKIDIIGLKDPAFDTSTYMDGANVVNLESHLKNLSHKDNFQILLSHRPEVFSVYEREGIDLSFTGHAHGGQFRFPFIGGFVAPDQGLFPKYTSGSHKLGESTMIVSRGLGNSIIPIRIFNRPEIIELVFNINE